MATAAPRPTALPPGAKTLAAHAEAHGWHTTVDTGPGVYAETTVSAGHPDGTRYVLIWVRQFWRDPSGPYRLEGGWTETPGVRTPQPAAPLRAVRDAVTQRPVETGA